MYGNKISAYKSKEISMETARINTRTILISCPFPFTSIKKNPKDHQKTVALGILRLYLSLLPLIKLILVRDPLLKREDIQ